MLQTGRKKKYEKDTHYENEHKRKKTTMPTTDMTGAPRSEDGLGGGGGRATRGPEKCHRCDDFRLAFPGGIGPADRTFAANRTGNAEEIAFGFLRFG